MRIVSLSPAATEILFALEIGDDILGATHACDYPAQALEIPRVTVSGDSTTPSNRQRSGTVTSRQAARRPLNYDLLAEIKPDLVVTDAISLVHDLSPEEVQAAAAELETQPLVIVLDPRTIGEVISDVRTLAQATDRKDAAVDLVRECSDRIDRVRLKTRRTNRPRVVALESLEPPRVAGRWLPQMIDYAGGEDVLGFAGEESTEFNWDVLVQSEPDIVLVMPGRLDAEIAYREAEMHHRQLSGVGAGEIVALDAGSYFSRPGPRLVDGLEILAHIIHPELVPEHPDHAGAALTVKL
jgi:iron complex transport system substrate-binding protein